MTRSMLLSGLMAALLFHGCARPEPPPRRDHHSFSNPGEISIRHIDLNLRVDFALSQLSGSARLHLLRHTDTDTLILDTRGLQITQILLNDAEPAAYKMTDDVPGFGQALRIRVFNHSRTVTIHYATGKDAAALQWLTAEQTAGKSHPFLFTQSQAILARTWVPCQDSPGARFTYSATIQCPSDLMAVMSATNDTVLSPDGRYRFEMRQSIPSYLLALAVGDFRFRSLGPRTGIYAEPETLDKAAWEFADIERMLEAAERLLGPYRWERYDVIVLPPSFPFGGMENPRLTFATPTIIAGDKSLVALIAHEMAHSWSGNLVTNAVWNDIWLNEGLTTYFERRIVEEVYGQDYAEMEAMIARQLIDEELAEIGANSELSGLYQHIDSLQPEDASEIVYEKGSFLCRLIEERAGRARWDAFIKQYFNDYAFRPITTKEFLRYFDRYLVRGDTSLASQLDMDAWIFGRGIPANCPVPHSAGFAKVDTEIGRWKSGTPPSQLATSGLNSQQWIHFLRNISSVLTHAQMEQLDRVFGFSRSGNSEVLFVWLQHVIRSRYTPAYPALEKFLIEIGRRKFVKPLYTAMAEDASTKELARLIYQKARPGYHPITYMTVDELLK